MRTELFTNCVDLVGSACRPFDGTKCYVSTGAVDTDHIDDCNIEIVDYVGKPSRANLEVDPGDVLFAKMQGTKKTLLIDSDLANHIYSTGFCAVRAKEDLLNRRCLYHLLSSEAFLTQKDRNCSGATQKAITNSGLKKIVIKIPSIEKQDSIANQLDCISRIIEKRKKELETLDELIKARFVEMFGDMKLNPCGWDEHTFSELSILITDGEHATPRRTDEGIYLLSARNVLNHSLQLKDVDYIDQEEYDRIAKRIVPKEGDVLISCSGTVGRCCSVPTGLKFQMVRSAALVRFKDYINPVFAEYMITSDYLQDQINSSKTASSQANLFQGKIAKLKGFVPPIELQNEFVNFVAQVDKSKVALQKALDEAQLLFDSLMQEYFG